MPSFAFSEVPGHPTFKKRDENLPKKPESTDGVVKRDMEDFDHFILPQNVKKGWMTTLSGLKEYARKFISVEKEPDPNTQLIRRADFQNRIIRAFFSGEIGNISSYRKQLNDVILDMAIEKKLPNPTQDVSKVFDGIEPAIDAIQKDRTSFAPQGQEEQIFGLNEILDAHSSIDYVEFKYDHANNRIDGPVRLVQVKRSLLSEAEMKHIRRKHQEYVNGLFDRASLNVLIEKPAQEKQNVFLTGVLFEAEMSKLETQEQKDAWIENKLLDVIYALIEMIQVDPNDQDLQRLGEHCQISVPFMKLMILNVPLEKLEEITSILAEASDVDVIPFLSQINALKVWIESTGISAAECLQMDPKWEAPPNLSPTTKFESVIWHGGRQEPSQPLTADTSLTIN